MSRSWSIAELRQQLLACGSRWAQSVSDWSSPQQLLLGLTLVFMALAGAFESPLLFLLAVTQGVILFRLPRSERAAVNRVGDLHDSKAWPEIRQMLPAAATIQHVAGVIGTVLYRLLFRVVACLSITLAIGLVTLSYFVLSQPELWQWHTLDTAGPPLGSVLVTGVATLLSLLTTGWIASRRPILPH